VARHTARMRVRASRRPAVIVAVAAVLIVFAVIGVRSYVSASRVRWVKTEVAPELARLAEGNRLFEALRLHREASRYVPASRELEGFAETLRARQFSIRTEPPGATIYVADYVDVGEGGSEAPGRPHWVELGVSPLETNTIPTRGYYRVRVEKAGFVPIEQAFGAIAARPLELRLNSEATSPPGMVWIPGIRAGETLSWEVAAPMALPGYWLDRYEVTNREFKAFVTAGGYLKSEYWKGPFVKDGRSLSWQEAMEQFRDTTGLRGPATWQLGTYSDGTADLPVGGVSWYEAAAFAAFSSRSLPTIYHWFGAAGIRIHSDILGLSNFRGKGPDPVGRNRGVTTFGAYDMAGNVKEWVANPVGDRRFIVDARKPLERRANFGFRRALYGARPPDAVVGPVALNTRGRRNDAPVGEDVFRIYATSHGYDKADLQSKVESVDTTHPYIRKETVSFRAAYGDERVISHLYFPKEGTPPHQIVFFVPGASIFTVRSVDALSDPFEFLVRSGRAVMITALKGTLEREPSGLGLLGPNDLRDRLLQMSKDVQRSIDYLQTRPKDIDVGKLAYYGLSGGGALSPLWLAVEKRIKTAVLVSTGTLTIISPPADVDPWNYAPRVKIPVLMLNGRDDFTFLVETHQKPFFKALGSAPTEKRHELFDGGHVNVTTRPDVIREFLNWLNRYLGSTETTE
jgi:eukaryotic-like serine/threonine-protein kinase